MNSKVKIAIIGTNGLPGRYGGWDQLMEHLTKMLSHKYSFVVYCTSINSNTNLRVYNNSKLVYIPLKPNGWQSVLYDIFSSIHAVFYADKVLLLGGAGTLMFPFLRAFNIEVIYHVAGLEWKRDKFSKMVRLIIKLFEKIGIYWGNKIISDNEEIRKYVEASYNRTSYLIEYGGNHVLKKDLPSIIAKKYKIESGFYAFKVCRIEPENNIHLILEAFINSKLKLVIVGNWQFSVYGKELFERYSKYENLLLLHPIYDQEQLDMLRSNCGIYIHGHSVGGTNPSLVEAMYLGLNVLAFDVSFNRITTHNAAKYFNTSEELCHLVNKFYADKMIYNEVGVELNKIAVKRYSWERIVLKYDEMFGDIQSF